MELSNLKPAAGSKHSNNFRKGRGHGSGNGKTAGYGHKGQKHKQCNRFLHGSFSFLLSDILEYVYLVIFQDNNAFPRVFHQQGILLPRLADLFFHFGLGGNIFRHHQQTVRRPVRIKHGRFDRVHDFYAFAGGRNQLLRDILFALAFKYAQVGLAQELGLVLVDIGTIRSPSDYIGRRYAKEFLTFLVPQDIFAVVIFYGKRYGQVVNNRLQEVFLFGVQII